MVSHEIDPKGGFEKRIRMWGEGGIDSMYYVKRADPLITKDKCRAGRLDVAGCAQSC